MTSRSPFPLLKHLPASLRDVILSFHWDLERLHALDLPERSVAVDELAWHLELPFWAVDGRPFQVTPIKVAAAPEHFRDQWERTMAASLDHPLDGYVRADGRLVILDGVHRLLKARQTGRQWVRMRLLDASQFDAIAMG